MYGYGTLKVKKYSDGGSMKVSTYSDSGTLKTKKPDHNKAMKKASKKVQSTWRI